MLRGLARKRFNRSLTARSDDELIAAVLAGETAEFAELTTRYRDKVERLCNRFFADNEETSAAPVCVLGAAARSNLFGSADPIGQYVKANETWFRVIGVASPQLSSQTEVAGVPTQDLNNIMYVPLNSAMLRLEDNYSDVRDEIDGIYLNIRENADMGSVAQLVRAILDSSHHSAGDFSVILAVGRVFEPGFPPD